MLMSDSKENQTHLLRHYTNVDAMFHILDEGFRFGTPSKNWDDQNDAFCVSLYAKRHKKKAYVLCFCIGLGNFHHWNYFGGNIGLRQCKDCYKGIKCNIVMNRESVENLLSEQNMNLRDVIRLEKNELRHNTNSIPDANLPFLKRSEYWIEQEARVVVLKSPKAKIPTLKIPIEQIEYVTLLLDPDSQQYKEIKEKLNTKYPNLKVEYSGIKMSKEWQHLVTEKLENINKQNIQQ